MYSFSLSVSKGFLKINLCLNTSKLQRFSTNYASEEFKKRLKTIEHVFDLREPSQYYSEARAIKRKIIYHAGPTNSGKTHHALQNFFSGSSGVYCGPLRMLAAEIYHKTNQKDIPCDMITGEERLWATDKGTPSNHISCTVEMCSTHHQFEVAVIDEIQMLRCPERGWAWTRALLGIPAKEIHLCGEPAGLDIVKKMLNSTKDTLEVYHYKRLTNLRVEKNIVQNIKRLKEGDCLVAFSQKKIYDYRKLIEDRLGLKCSVVYGRLPSNIRLEQAKQFNEGHSKILIASDAIGMGMNLNIQRIIFSSLDKFDGKVFGEAPVHHIKQIAGRAGRYRSKYKNGYVSTLQYDDLRRLHSIMAEEIPNIKKAGILPSLEQFELLSMVLPEKSLAELTEVFELLMKLDRNYFLCDVEKFKLAADELQHIPLTLQQSYIFAVAPVNISRDVVLPAMNEFAWRVCENVQVTSEDVKDILKWPPRKKPRSVRSLQYLEHLHETLDLYRWLSYRFEDIFIDRKGVNKLQSELERYITRAVETNMKYDTQDSKHLQHYVARKKRRKWRR
ncbi:ATP-dependent RNA helicase SUPV3L1, mitochondrial-like [Clytia hemisphaerica]|uniref:RNA helicase n=1 Tax=Clytia hemisphaerica TaxID=252671 RepID=A0A7M5V963_9CNID